MDPAQRGKNTGTSLFGWCFLIIVPTNIDAGQPGSSYSSVRLPGYPLARELNRLNTQHPTFIWASCLTLSQRLRPQRKDRRSLPSSIKC
jgi:hypothetical protein